MRVDEDAEVKILQGMQMRELWVENSAVKGEREK
jgi:hypothetical protein